MNDRFFNILEGIHILGTVGYTDVEQWSLSLLLDLLYCFPIHHNTLFVSHLVKRFLLLDRKDVVMVTKENNLWLGDKIGELTKPMMANHISENGRLKFVLTLLFVYSMKRKDEARVHIHFDACKFLTNKTINIVSNSHPGAFVCVCVWGTYMGVYGI